MSLAAAAGKAGGKAADYLPLLAVAGLIIAAIYVYSNSSGSSGYQIVGATNNSAERTAVDAQNAALATAHEQNVTADFGALVGEATSAYNADTQVTLGNQQLTEQLAGIQAEAQIAALSAQTQQAQANAALDAAQAQAHAQQQTGLWASLSSIFSSGLAEFTGAPHTSSSGYTGAAPNAGSFGSWN